MFDCTKTPTAALMCPGTAISDSLARLPLTTLDELMGVELIYLVGVVALVGRLMRDFHPGGLVLIDAQLKLVIAMYDWVQVMLNAAAVGYVLLNPSLAVYAWRNLDRVSFVVDSPAHQQLLLLGMGWYYLKVLDLLDTLFFTLRGKFSHVSVLQVYHHASMVVLVWVSFHYAPVNQNLFYALLNSMVHVVLYLYYMLATLGIPVTWKQLVTRVQMAQFVAMLAFTAYLLANVHTDARAVWYTGFLGFQATAFMALFANFYRKRYIQGRKAPRCAADATPSLLRGRLHQD